jgi:hypothetical protein
LKGETENTSRPPFTSPFHFPLSPLQQLSIFCAPKPRERERVIYRERKEKRREESLRKKRKRNRKKETTHLREEKDRKRKKVKSTSHFKPSSTSFY